MTKAKPEFVGRFARSIESGWIGKIVGVETDGNGDAMYRMQGVNELCRMVAGGPMSAHLDNDDTQWFAHDDLRFLSEPVPSPAPAPAPAPATLAAGVRVILRREVERFPSFMAKAGERGTVKEFAPGVLWVKMDRPLRGAAAWDNCIAWCAELFAEWPEDLAVLSVAGDAPPRPAPEPTADQKYFAACLARMAEGSTEFLQIGGPKVSGFAVLHAGHEWLYIDMESLTVESGGPEAPALVTLGGTEWGTDDLVAIDDVAHAHNDADCWLVPAAKVDALNAKCGGRLVVLWQS